MQNTYKTREEWLIAFTNAARPIFDELGAPLPTNIKAGIGYPTTGYRSKVAGQCIYPETSADAHFNIFINPNETGDARIADILTHELCHTALEKRDHGKAFQKLAKAVGLTGKATATVAGPDWHAWAKPILEELGPMPHGQIILTGPAKKKQTFQHKVDCPDCGWLARVNAKHCQHDYMSCPVPDCGGILFVHPLKGQDDEGED
jgi:hypothetical protein